MTNLEQKEKMAKIIGSLQGNIEITIAELKAFGMKNDAITLIIKRLNANYNKSIKDFNNIYND